MRVRRFIFDHCKPAACALLALLFLIPAARAETVRWQVFGTGTWFRDINWDTGTLPTADDLVIIDTGGTARVSSPGAVARQISINPVDFQSGGIDVDSPGTLKLEAADSELVFERGEIAVLNADALLKVQGPAAGEGDLFIGGFLDTNGNAEMLVTRGARVETGQTFVSGFDSAGINDPVDRVVVQDSGTEWQIDTALQIGLIGSAEFSIIGGARVYAGTVDIGIDRTDLFSEPYDGASTVTISGDGSELVTTGTVGIGRDGSGTLIVDEGGRLTLQGTGTDGTVELGFGSGGAGVLLIGDGAVIDAEQIISFSADHQIVFNHNADLWLTDTGTAAGTPVTIDGSATVAKQGAGTLRLSGTNAWAAGSTTISGGRLLVNGSVETTTPITVQSGAVLGGRGVIAPTEVVVESDAALEPGDDGPGSLVVFGNQLLLGDTSAIRVDLNQPGPGGVGNDLLDIGFGDVVLDGVIAVNPGPDFRPGEFVIAEYGGTLTNRGVSVQGLPAGLSAAVSAGGGQVVLIVSGPQLALDPSGALDFGTVAAGSASAGQSVQLTNVGDEVLTIQAIGAPSDPAFLEVGRDCPDGAFALNPGQSCQIEYRFEPSSPGTFSAAVPIDTTGAAGPDRIEMIGTGTEGPQLTVTPEIIDFGDQPLGVPAAAQTVTITNIGAGDLVLDLLELTGQHSDDYMIVSDGCSGAVLVADASCQVELDFAPLEPGVRRADLTVPSNDPAGPHAVRLIGSHDVMFFDGFEGYP